MYRLERLGVLLKSQSRKRMSHAVYAVGGRHVRNENGGMHVMSFW